MEVTVNAVVISENKKQIILIEQWIKAKNYIKASMKALYNTLFMFIKGDLLSLIPCT